MPIAIIDGGSSISTPFAAPFNLSGSNSQNVDGSASTLSYVWSCQTSQGAPCIDLGTSSAISLPNSAVLSLPGSSLAVGPYKFTLTVTSSYGLNSSASKAVEVVAGTPPIVSILRTTQSLLNAVELSEGKKVLLTMDW
jgi:hypothetical protein